MSIQLAQLHNARAELESLVTRRAGMIAANIACEIEGMSPKYSEEDFEQLAKLMGYTAVNQRDFG